MKFKPKRQMFTLLILSSLLLMLILPQIIPRVAYAYTQNIVNGGFETGDMTGWLYNIYSGTQTTTYDPHSGTYCCLLPSSSNIGQDFYPYISVDGISSFVYWARSNSSGNSLVSATVWYSDSSYTQQSAIVGSSWTLEDITPTLSAGKSITNFIIAAYINNASIDDVSLLTGTGVTTHNLYVFSRWDNGSSTDLNAYFTENGSMEQTPYYNASTVQGSYLLVRQNASLNGNPFSHWYVIYLDNGEQAMPNSTLSSILVPCYVNIEVIMVYHSPPIEYIANGGFEIGDFTDWTHSSGATVVSWGQHSGSYCCLMGVGDWVQQQISPTVVVVNGWQQFSFWAAAVTGSTTITADINYVSAPSTQESFSVSSTYEHCVIAGNEMTMGQTINSITITELTAGVYVDDVSLLSFVPDTTPPLWHSYSALPTTLATDCNFTCNWTDDHAVAETVFSWNPAGSWITTPPEYWNSANITANSTELLPAVIGTIVKYKWVAWDTSGNENSTQTFSLTVSPNPIWWTLPQHDVTFSSCTNAASPTSNMTQWNQTVYGRWWSDTPLEVDSSPCVYNGSVYDATASGLVSCINALTGARVWTVNLEAVYALCMFSSPAFYAGNLFITDTSYPVSSNQGHLFCQNASTGVLKWTQPIGENWYSSPTVYDGDIYACGGGYLRCFDMAGDLLWASNPAVATVGASASPTIGDGRVYVGDAHDGVDAFSVDDGTFLWHHIFNFTVFGSHQAIFIGCPILFVQSPAPSLGWQSMIYVTNCGGYEWALNAITGEQVWNQTLSATNNQPYLIYGSQAFAFGKESLGLGNIFVSSEYHKVIYELDNMTGEIIREIHTSVVSYGGFAISNTTGLIYIAGIGGVQAFHILDGSLVWSRLWSTGEPDLGIMSSPAIAEFNGVGWLYVGMPDGKLYSFATIIPPDTCIVNVLSSPFIVGSVGFTINGGVSLSTPYSASLNGTYTFARSQATVTVNSSMIYGFCQWVVENGSGTFRFSGSSVTLGIITGTNYVILNYTAVRIVLSSSPECHATFGSDLGYSYNTPQVLYYPNGTHTFTVPATIPINASYKDGFSHWIVNNSRSYTTLSLSLNFQDPTVLTVFYTLIYAPWIPPQTYGALNATWYMRSDTQTVHGVLGFKLLTVNTHTPTWDSLIYSYNGTVSYGVRVWAFDLFGNEFELTSGVPAAVVTITNGSIGLFNAIWICPAYNSMIDAIMVDVYQRFGSGSWTLRRIFVTDSDLLIWLPQAAWTFHYWLSWKDGVGNSTFAHGSYNIFDSRVDLSYIPADPWDVALARLQQQNFIGFLFTPWTYWFGDLFWTILLFGCIVMGWLRTGSLKPILGLLWLLGGSGSILWALIPPVALHVAVLMLALAMAITLFRLIYGR